MEPTVTELEDKIRQALQDPHWTLAAWPDPMPRIRREAAKQRTRLAVLTAALAAAVVTPLALLPAVIGLGSPSHHPVPHHRAASWAKRLPGEIAYQCGNYICLERPDGTARSVLPPARFPQWTPAWSPDGRRLAYRGYYGIAEGDSAIFVADANGCHARKLARTNGGTSPTWSPTGRQIAFALGGIKVINADGTGLRTLTSDLARSGRSGPDDEFPAWSAANRIAFTRFMPHNPDGEIYVMNADGSGVRAITHGGRDFEQPAWSPDGRQIAFTATYGQPGTVIDVASADGSGMHRVSPPRWMSYDAVWTPHGQVAFLVDRPTGTSIYIVSPDGTGLRRLPRSWPDVQTLIQFAWGTGSLPPAPSHSGCT
jgi:Tol biopolymer transport system component